MTGRREARRVAIDVLYRCDLTGSDPADMIRDWREAGREVSPFAEGLVRGVTVHLPEIDGLLEQHAEDWTVARMAALDRTILRVAVYELLHGGDVPPSVAISEAVEAASELSADEARRFVNGILGRIAREHAPGKPGAPGIRPPEGDLP